MITGAQIRAARALIRWSASQLAKQADMSLPTLQRMEREDGVPSAYTKNVASVQKTLERAGVAFLSENGGGDGVPFAQSFRLITAIGRTFPWTDPAGWPMLPMGEGRLASSP